MPDGDECCEEREWWGFRKLRGSGKHSGIKRPWAEAAKNEPGVFEQQPEPGWLELSGWGEGSGRGWGREAKGVGREEPLQDFIRIRIWEELEGPDGLSLSELPSSGIWHFQGFRAPETAGLPWRPPRHRRDLAARSHKRRDTPACCSGSRANSSPGCRTLTCFSDLCPKRIGIFWKQLP